MAQDEASRRRLRVLSHLPLTGAFKLCEVDLSQHLPPEALAPFVEELAQRERRRAQRAKQVGGGRGGGEGVPAGPQLGAARCTGAPGFCARLIRNSVR